MKAKNFYISLFLILAVILLANLLVYQLVLRLDLTEDRQYTLSKASRDIIQNLPEQVHIQVYFTDELPADAEKVHRDFQEMLVEYANLSRGDISYVFTDPSKNAETEEEALKQGIRPVMINVREKDQVKQQKAFMGAVVQMGDQTEVIPFIQPGGSMEYMLSTAIKKISVIDKKVIGFLQGHGEAGPGEMQQVAAQLQVLYHLQTVEISDTSGIPEHIHTLAVINPRDSLPPSHMAEIERFLAQGGNLFLAFNAVDADFSSGTPMGMPVESGWRSWLAGKGLKVDSSFVVDASCGSVNVQQQQGFFTISSAVKFPYLPVVKDFIDHPVSQGLEAMVMQFVSPMIYTGDTTFSFTPLLTSSSKSDTEYAPLYMDVQKEWTDADFPKSGLMLAGILEGPLAGNVRSRMIVVADGDFAVGGAGQNARQVQPDNAHFVANSIDWLSDDTGLIELRTRGTVWRPIKEMEDAKKSMLKWLNFALPLLLVILYGVYRYQKNRMIRIKRMEENYE